MVVRNDVNVVRAICEGKIPTFISDAIGSNVEESSKSKKWKYITTKVIYIIVQI